MSGAEHGLHCEIWLRRSNPEPADGPERPIGRPGGMVRTWSHAAIGCLLVSNDAHIRVVYLKDKQSRFVTDSCRFGCEFLRRLPCLPLASWNFFHSVNKAFIRPLFA